MRYKKREVRSITKIKEIEKEASELERRERREEVEHEHRNIVTQGELISGDNNESICCK